MNRPEMSLETSSLNIPGMDSLGFADMVSRTIQEHRPRNCKTCGKPMGKNGHICRGR